MDNEGSNAARTRREGPAMRVPSPFQRPLKQKMAQVSALHRKEYVTQLQGDPYGRGKDYVDIKFKVPSQAWTAGQTYS